LPVERSLAFLGRDAQSATERVTGDRFEAGLLLTGRPAKIGVELRPGRARATLHSRHRLGEDSAAEAHAYLLRRLGLDAEPAAFERQVRADPSLAPLIRGRRGLRVPRTGDAFECLAWTVVGQQISLPFARTLFRRLAERTGQPAGDGLYTPPAPAAVAALEADELTAVQFSQRKAEYLIGAARDIADGRLDLEGLHLASATRAEQRLLAVHGLGPWSVHYLLMRGFGFEDCVPVGDAGLVRALMHFFELDERPDPARTLALMERFRPYRTFATFHLWMSLQELS
jgi:AraC family transcriptional regulator of adaptative response / DNA-3-methyladenine glycosylase II